MSRDAAAEWQAWWDRLGVDAVSTPQKADCDRDCLRNRCSYPDRCVAKPGAGCVDCGESTGGDWLCSDCATRDLEWVEPPTLVIEDRVAIDESVITALMDRCEALETALRALVERVELVGGWATTEQQQAYRAAKGLLR